MSDVERIPVPQASPLGHTPGLMRSHTVTVYNALGEIDRVAAYRRTVLEGVRVEERSGAVATMQGRSSTDGVMVYIPGTVAGFVDSRDYDGDEGWTLRAGDFIAIGECELDLPPATVPMLEADSHVFRITGVEPLTDRRGRVHHWEVSGS